MTTLPPGFNPSLPTVEPDVSSNNDGIPLPPGFSVSDPNLSFSSLQIGSDNISGDDTRDDPLRDGVATSTASEPVFDSNPFGDPNSSTIEAINSSSYSAPAQSVIPVQQNDSTGITDQPLNLETNPFSSPIVDNNTPFDSNPSDINPFVINGVNAAVESNPPVSPDTRAPKLEKRIPSHWGDYPTPNSLPVKLLVDLPDGYGVGTSDQAAWIADNISRDRADGTVVIMTPLSVPESTPTHLASFQYDITVDDEMQLAKGDLIHVYEQGPDGWFIGVNVNTGSRGTFPGNYVIPLEENIPQQEQHTVPIHGDKSNVEDDAIFAARLQQEEEDARLAEQLDNEQQDNADAAFAAKLQQQESAFASQNSSVQSSPVVSSEAVTSTPSEPPQGSYATKMTNNLSSPEEFDGELTDVETYFVNFMGSIKVPRKQGNDIIMQAIRSVQFARRKSKVKADAYQMRIGLKGIMLVQDTRTKQQKRDAKKGKIVAVVEVKGSICKFKINAITYCAYDPRKPKYFAFISKQNDSDGRTHAAHVFEFDKSSVSICNAIGRSFKAHVASKKSLKAASIN
eukprot:UC4_evm1s1127